MTGVRVCACDCQLPNALKSRVSSRVPMWSILSPLWCLLCPCFSSSPLLLLLLFSSSPSSSSSSLRPSHFSSSLLPSHIWFLVPLPVVKLALTDCKCAICGQSDSGRRAGTESPARPSSTPSPALPYMLCRAHRPRPGALIVAAPFVMAQSRLRLRRAASTATVLRSLGAAYPWP